MSKENDGGKAFPVPEIFDERRGDIVQYGIPGLNMRDYFAAKVCAAAYTGSTGLGYMSQEQLSETMAAVAKLAYAAADAMLLARDA